MDDLKSIDVLQPNSQPTGGNNPKGSKAISKIAGVIAILGYVALRLGLFGFISEIFEKPDRNRAHEAAKSAIVEFYTQPEDEPIEAHIERMCSFTTKDFCDYYSEAIADVYEEYFTPMSCTLDYSEYLENLDLEDSSNKAMSFNITYTVDFEESGNSEQYSEIIIMEKENGWKMYDVLSTEDYNAAIIE
jgi:hypothetical protein